MELAVVITIIGIVSAMSLPGMRKANESAKINTYVNDLRVFSGAFDQYAQVNGEWPNSQITAQSFPDGMEGYLANSSWTRISPIGGSCVWDRDVLQNGRTLPAVISLFDVPGHPISVTSAQLEDIDLKIDDGNLATGIFQLGFGDLPIYIVDGSSEPGAAPPPAPPPPAAGGGAFGGGFAGSLLLLGMARLLRRKERKS